MGEKQKEVLLITYYWPPGGGPGVHRWLRFSKFFHAYGAKLHVYCPKDAAWPIRDEKLQDEVVPEVKEVRRTVFEPHKYLGKKNNPNVGGGLTKKKKSSFFQDLIIWIRGNLFVPDARRFWINPSYRFLKGYLKKHPEIQCIISTGPPHSLHVIALKLKRKTGIRWIADFRDPWTDIDFYEELKIGERADRKQKALELACLKEADEVITVSESCASGLEEIGQRSVQVVTNGFIFPDFDSRKQNLGNLFSITHFGSMPSSRNPVVLWKALQELIHEGKLMMSEVRIKLYGPVDHVVFDSIQQHGLMELLEYTELVTHQESIALQRSTPLLLLVANQTGNVQGILTGKFFEYLGAKRPILAIGSKGSDLDKAMTHTSSGAFVDFEDVERAKEVLLEYAQQFQTDSLYIEAKNLQDYSSENLAKKIVEMC
ncbi:MAG: glycosyl transferase family 1 [Bacteroidetes bacterium]|nr:MAG: glycosyl transferase family 1 [Bacteroidota bacterium]